MKKDILRGGMLGLLGLLLSVESSQSGGLYLYEVATPDVGLAAAGYAARAQDASTSFTNPAGMTRIKQPTVTLGAQPMYLQLEFDPDASTSAVAGTLPGGQPANDGDSNSWMPAGGFYYVHPVNEKLRLGLATTGYFGLSLDYQDDWVGRYYAQEASLQAAAIQPAIAWRVNDLLSVGAGVAVLYGMLEEEVAVNNINPLLDDGKLKVKDEEWDVQYNLGILLEPAKGTRFGLTYLSEADLDFSDQIEFSGLGPVMEAALDSRGTLDAEFDLGLTMPQAVMLSAYHEFTDRIALLANLGWQDWSQFGKVEIGVSSAAVGSITTDLDYDDTWHAAFGIQYQQSKALLLTGGIAYDSSMLDEDEISPMLPVGETWRFALGTAYNWSENIKLGAAYELGWVGDLDMDVDRGPLAGRVSGTYESTAIHIISLNAEWRF
jgi:long-chain fatty acid transport protein